MACTSRIDSAPSWDLKSSSCGRSAIKQFENLIAGEWTRGNAAGRDVNPSDTNDIVGEYADATVADAVQALDAARSAWPGWARATAQVRADVLSKAAAELLARRDEIGELLAREEGKTRAEAVGEVV